MERLADQLDPRTERCEASLRCPLRLGGHSVPTRALQDFRAEVCGSLSATLDQC